MGRPTNYSHETPREIADGYKYHVTIDQRNSLKALTGTTEELYSLVSSHSAIWDSSGGVSRGELIAVSGNLQAEIISLSGELSLTNSNIVELSAQVQNMEKIYECLDLDAYSSCQVDILPVSAYGSCEWDYMVKAGDGLSIRRGEMLAAWRSIDTDGALTEVSTPDLGHTTGVSFSVVISANFARLIATNSGPIDNWIIRVQRFAL